MEMTQEHIGVCKLLLKIIYILLFIFVFILIVKFIATEAGLLTADKRLNLRIYF